MDFGIGDVVVGIVKFGIGFVNDYGVKVLVIGDMNVKWSIFVEYDIIV